MVWRMTRRLITTFAISLLMTACTGNANEALKVGEKIPAVTCPDQDGKPVKLAESAGKGVALVYFYPKADTPGCTKQGCSLRDGWAELQSRKVTVYGVSMDSSAAQKAFKEKYALPFPLLADKSGVVTKAFQGGSMMASVGFAKRQAYLFRDGVCIMADTNAPTSGQAEKVIRFLDTPAAPATPATPPAPAAK